MTKTRKILLLSLGFFFVFGFSNVSYYLPLYYQQTGLASTERAGWLVSAFYISSIICRPLLGGVVQRFGFRRIFITAGVIGVVSSLGVALPRPGFWLPFLSRSLLGVASSLFLIALATYQAVAFPKEERGSVFSLIGAGGLAPMMTLVPLADYLLRRGWNGAYILLPALACLGAALLTPQIPELEEPLPKPNRKGDFAQLLNVLHIPELRFALFATLLFSITDAAAAFMNTMTSSRGQAASLFLSSNAVVGVCARLFFVTVIDRFPRERLATVTTLLTAGTLLGASFAPSGRELVILGMIYGIGMGFGFPLHQALVSDCAPRELQPQAVSLLWFLMGCSFAFVPLLSGLLSSSIGPVITFRFLSGTVLILTVALPFFRARSAKQHQFK